MVNLKSQKETARKELKSILSQYRDSYNSMCETSRNSYMKTLPPGAIVPKSGQIYGDEARAEFESLSAGFRERIKNVISNVTDALRDRATESPSNEAVNSITLLKMRNEITRNEVEDLLLKYGDNPQAWNTIVSIASDHKIYIDNHPIGQELQAVEDLGYSIDRVMYSGASSKIAGEGLFDMMAMQIDEALSTGGEE